MAHLSLALLGSFQVRLDGAPLTSFDSDKVRALLAYLVLEAERPHRRAALAGLLWPERPERAAHLSLNQALSNMRRILGDRTAPVPVLRITPETIQFDRASDHDLDVTTFSDLLAACARHPHRHVETCTSCTRRLHQAADLYCGGLLDQFFLRDSAAFEEWVLLKREQLHLRALGAHAQLAEYHARCGDEAQALHATRRLLELDPWREASHRQLMRLLARSGQRSAALAQYATCRRALVAELGVEPELETTALHEQIQRGEALTDAWPGLPATNLAAHTPLSPFIGRETELAQLADRLEQRDCRLLTLVGPGGVGKTRLALQAAADLRASFGDGVAFVPLAALNSVELLVPAIVGALGLTFAGSADPKAQLLAYLRTKDMLLVLDNFEQLLAGAEVLIEIIQSAPGVVLLATSREPLNLRVEWLLDIQGLPVPERADASGVEQSSAVDLFVQTASRIQAGFALSPATSPSVVRICQLVGGIPLAIELAAAWVRSRSCGEIAQDLEHNLEQLATTMRDVPARHHSTRAVFDHSWHLLSAAEQGVLRRLAVFRGGIDSDAAIEVTGTTPWLLMSLVDKSLLRRNAMGRYDLHELVRQYAGEKLHEAGETERTADNHLTYFLALAEQAEPELHGFEQVGWLNHLESEHDNLRAALRWSLEEGAVEPGLRMAGALGSFWSVRAYHNEGRRWLDTALRRADLLPKVARAKALRYAGFLALEQTDYPQTILCCEASLALYRELEDQDGIAVVLRYLGIVADGQGNHRQAEALLGEALARYQALNHSYGIAVVLFNLGMRQLLQGDFAQAHQYCAQSLALYRELGPPLEIGEVLTVLGCTVLAQGDVEAAAALLIEGLPLLQQVGDKLFTSFCLTGLAGIAVARQQLECAAHLLSKGESLRETGAFLVSFGAYPMYQNIVAPVRAQLSDATFAAAWAAGRTMPLEQAIAEALQIAG